MYRDVRGTAPSTSRLQEQIEPEPTETYNISRYGCDQFQTDISAAMRKRQFIYVSSLQFMQDCSSCDKAFLMSVNWKEMNAASGVEPSGVTF